MKEKNKAGLSLSPEDLINRRPELDAFLKEARLPVAAVLENIRSMFNVGSIFRSADACRLKELLICGYTAHPPREEISKTALGAEEFVPWEFWSRAAQACTSLKEEGYQVVALEHTSTGIKIEELEITAPLAFVVGNEVTGVSQECLDVCDAAIELPMSGMKDSLNVSVAFGVAAYQLRAKMLSSEWFKQQCDGDGIFHGHKEYPKP